MTTISRPQPRPATRPAGAPPPAAAHRGCGCGAGCKCGRPAYAPDQLKLGARRVDPAAAQAARAALAAAKPPVAPPAPADEPTEPVSRPAPVSGQIRWRGRKPVLAKAQEAAFEKLEGARRERLAQAVASDPVIQQALAAWPALTRKEKLAVMQRVADLQGQIFRFTPATMTIDPKLEKDKVYGTYDDEETRRIDIGAWVFDQKDPKDLLDTVVHEQFHVYQHQKYHDERRGVLPKDHPIAPAARRWLHNAKHYTEQEKNDKQYRRQPLESHAWTAAAKVLKLLKAPRG